MSRCLRPLPDFSTASASSESKKDCLLRLTAQEQIEAPDRARFIEVVDTQLLSLHGGNFARYRLRLSEFHAWSEVWKELAQ